MMRYLILFCGLPIFLTAQVEEDNSEVLPDAAQQLVEDVLQNTDSEGIFDFNTAFEELEELLENPIDLNRAEESDLRSLGFLNDRQINDFLSYRNTAGNLLSTLELQSIPSFDLELIQQILPYVTVKDKVDNFQVPIMTMLTSGTNEVYLRWSRVLEEQQGYRPLEEGETGSRYLGDQNRYYFRFKHAYENRLSYGVTAEKDPGETFFSGNNQQGFDFYSAHVFLKNYSNTIKAIALGDYTVTFGQGLILFSGFGFGKSSDAIRIKRSGQAIRPYTSVNEVNFMRGAATTLAFGDNLELTVFGSYRGRDGNLAVQDDTTGLDQEILTLTSLDTDGLHRTTSEEEDENAVNQLTFGGGLRYDRDTWHVGLNALLDRFDKAILRTPQPYNRFYFNGDQLVNASVDYSFIYRNLNFFGETALSDNGGWATTNALLIGLDPKLDLAIQQRHFEPDYQALNANPFAETSNARNETGLYLGVEVRPFNEWTLSAYYDIWEHPWLRFNVDAPSKGHEYRGRLTYYKKRNLTVYAEIFNEVEEINAPGNETNLNFLINQRIFRTRLHFAKTISKSLEVRSRVDWGFYENDVEDRQYGFTIYQDILYRPVGFPLSFTTRFALIDTESFDIRFFHFENDLLFNFSVPAYYGQGSRFYLNLRFRATRNLTMELRYSQTLRRTKRVVEEGNNIVVLDRDENFGSGLEEIEGPVRSELKAQIRYKF